MLPFPRNAFLIPLAQESIPLGENESVRISESKLIYVARILIGHLLR